VALRDLGLNELQERVYRLLVAQPDLRVADLAVQLKSTESDVRDALDALVDLSLASVDENRPANVRLPNPRVAVAQLIEQVEDDLLRRHRRVADTRAELDLLAGPRADVRWPSDVERLENLELVRERLDELAYYTRVSVFSIQPTGPLSSASLVAGRPLDERGLRRGIDMRIIYDEHVLEDDDNVEYVRRLGARGARIRIANGPLERLILMDESVAVVPIDPRNSMRGALVVREPGLIAGFVRLFRAAGTTPVRHRWTSARRATPRTRSAARTGTC